MTLAAGHFIGRFLQHILPPNLRRIRQYGLFAGAGRRAALAACRALLGSVAAAGAEQTPEADTTPVPACPRCGCEEFIDVRPLPEERSPPFLSPAPAEFSHAA